MNRSFVFFVLLCILSTFQLNAQTEAVGIKKSEEITQIDGKAYFLHTVLSRQTLYSIAKKYDVTVDEIHFNNPNSKSGLQPGQILKIPVVNKETEIVREMRTADFDFIYHIVNEGETFQQIANLYEVDLFDVKLANANLEEPLKQGEYIKIPVVSDEIIESHIPIPTQDENVNPDEAKNLVFVVEQEQEVALDKTKPYNLNGDAFYEVQPKETLFGICRRFKLTRTELEALNPGLTSGLSVGQILNFPSDLKLEKKPIVEVFQVQSIPEKKPQSLKTHTVEKQETLYGIARKYGVSIDELKTYNPGLDDRLSTGQIIKIPRTKITEPFIEHKVEGKTKLNRIARKYGLSYREIGEVNPELGRKLRSGDIVKIPVSRNLVTVPPKETPIEIDDRSPEEKANALSEIKEHIGIGISHQEEFKIALMVPMNLEDLDTLYQVRELYPEKIFNSPSLRYLQFIEGFKLAADSLANLGMNIKLYIYDVDANITKTVKLLQNEELKSMNLIVGPFYSRSFTQVSNFAKIFNIPIINPLTNRSEVLVNRNVFKIKPSLHQQGSVVNLVLSKHYPNSNIILVHDAKEKNYPEYRSLKEQIKGFVPRETKLLKSAILNSLKENGASKLGTVDSDGYRVDVALLKSDPTGILTIENKVHDIDYDSKFKEKLLKSLSKIRPNLVIVSTKNKVMALEILDRLNQVEDQYPLSAIGLPLWANYDKLNLEYLINLNTTIISEDYIDYNKEEVRNFVYKFRDVYRTEPNRYAFEGFDIGYYFLSLLGINGENFESTLDEYHPVLLKRSMNFFKSNKGGYENSYWIPLKYEGANLVPID